jgi:exopolysaccharide biosynthesis polyprenyl glycosylphosphotransferase
MKLLFLYCYISSSPGKGGESLKKRISLSKKAIALIQIVILLFIQFLITPKGFLHYFLILDILIIMGIYSFRGYEIENLKSLNNTLISYILGAFTAHLLMLVLIVLQSRQFPKLPFFTTGFVSITVLPAVAYSISKWYVKTLKPQYYLVIGKKGKIEEIMNEIQKASFGKIIVHSYINPNVEILSGLLELEKEKTFDKILIADPSLIDGTKYLLEEAERKGIEIVYLPTLVEDTLKRIPVEIIELFEEYYEISFSKRSESSMKRLIDIVGSIIGLVVFSPIMLIIAISILLEDGRPVVFKQKRVGKNEKPFTLFKFRSLKNADIDKTNPNKDIEKRAFRVGKIIRRLRFDEIPQFWNVLKGEMSIVGPRPEMIEFHQTMSKAILFYRYRCKVKPGITGWAQINFKHTTTIEDYIRKTEYDLYYVKNKNIFLDLSIILLTIETMLGMRGSR